MSVDPPPPQLDESLTQQQQPPPGALLAIFLIVLADLLGFSVIIPLLPFYIRMYATSDFLVGLLFSIYSACQLIAAPVLGLISDRHGRRPVLILSQIGSVIGFVLLGVATQGNWFTPAMGLALVYISRVIDGLSGGNISTAQAYISDVTTPQTRSRGMGVIGAAFGIGFTIGPAIGGVLGKYNVSYPAYAAAMFSAVAALQTYLRLPESRVHKESEAEMWLHPSRFKPIVSNSPLAQMLLISFISMCAFVMFETVFAIFMNDTFGWGPGKVGWVFALAGLVIAIVQGGLIGRLSRKLGEWPLVITGPLLVTTAMLVLHEVGARQVAGLIFVAVVLNATGRSLQTPTLSALISHTAPERQQGATFGLFHMLSSLSRVIGPTIAAAVYTKHHTAPFILAGAITFAAAVWTVVLRAAAPASENADVGVAASR